MNATRRVTVMAIALLVGMLPLIAADVKLTGTMFSTAGVGTPGSNAFDGNTNTYFEANNGAFVPSGGYVGLDLGAGGSKRVSKVRFHPRPGYALRMNGGKFQGGNDATNGVYTDLYTIPTTPPTAWSEATVSDTTAYRYLRYYGPNSGYCNIAELEFYTAPTPTIATTSPTNVTLTSATLTGNLSYTGDAPTTVFAYWGLSDGGTNGSWGYTNQFDGYPALGTVSTNVNLPTPDRYYYYRYAASNTAGFVWSTSSVSFMAGNVTVSATDTNAQYPGNTGVYTFSRPALATNEALTVSYAMSGSAISGVDYTLNAATFPAGSSSTTLLLTPVLDSDTSNETAVLSILPGTSYAVGAASNATVTVLPAAEAFDDWTYRMRISFPIPLNGGLTNFPALVNLSEGIDGARFSYAQFLSSAGGDLRFSDANGGMALDYEIENWDTNGTSAVWVKLPLLQSTNDYIYAYWGKATNAAPCTTNGAVWDSNSMGVWHFNEAPSASAGDIRNSVSNSVQAKSVNMEAGDLVTGLVGGALDFDGSNEYVTNVMSGTALSELTVSFWMRPDTTPSGQKGLFQWAQVVNSSAPFVLFVRGRSIPYTTMQGFIDSDYRVTTPVTDSVWTHVTLTLEPGLSPTKIYRLWSNGEEVGSYTDTNGIAGTQPNAAAIYFANGYNGYLDGMMDEARVSRVARSANWNYATWLNMASNGVFCACTDDPVGGAAIRTAAPSDVTLATATLGGELVAVDGDPVTILVHWGLTDGGTNGPWDATSTFPGTYSAGAFSTNVNLPTPDRYYFYRYAASNAAGVFWSRDTVSFMAARVSVTATDAVAQYPGNTGTFTFARPAAATNGAVTILYALSGTALDGLDYTLSGSASLSAGQASVPLTLTALVDGDAAPEDAILTILPDATNYLVGATSNATVTIQSAVISYFIANNASWTNPANWSGGFVPGAGQVGIIQGSPGVATQANANAVLAGPPAAIIIRSNGVLNVLGILALTEQNLVLDGGIFKSGFITHPTTISLGSNAFIQGSSHLILSGLIQDYAGSAGRLIISNTASAGYYTSLSHANNTYSGGTEVRFGSLVLPAAAVANAAGTGDIEIYPNASIHNQNVTHPPGLRVILKGGSIYSGANYGLYAPVLVWTNSDCRSPGPNSTLTLGSNLQDFDATHTGLLTVNCIPEARFSGNNNGFSGGIKITGNTLTCSAANSLGSGPVEVEAGTLRLTTVPTCANSNDVTLHAAGTLRLETSALLGRLSGTGTNRFATLNSLNAALTRGISPGTNSTTVGTLTVDGSTNVTGCTIILGASSTNTFHLRAPGDQDKVVFTNNAVNLTLNGALNIEKIDTLTSGDYTLFDLNGGTTSGGFTATNMPHGYEGTLATGSGDVVLTVQFKFGGSTIMFR